MTATPQGLPGHAKVELLRAMAQHWWAFVLRGAAALAFGVLTMLSPGLSLVVLLAFLAAWLAVEGAATLWQAISGKGVHGKWTWLDGLLSLGAALLLLLAPGLSLVALVLVAGGFAVVTGGMRIVMAVRLSELLLGLLGVVTVLFGAMLLAFPGSGLVAIAWIMAIEAMAMGAILVAFGLRLRRLRP